MKKLLNIILLGLLIFGLILGVQKSRDQENGENLIDLEPDHLIKVLTDEEMIAMLDKRGVDSDFGKNILAKKDSEENSASLENIYLAKKLLVEEETYEPKVEFFCFGQLGEDLRIDSIEFISLDKIYKKQVSANKIEEIEKFFYGTLNYVLIDSNRIHFNLNGEFHSSGKEYATIDYENHYVQFKLDKVKGLGEYVNIKDDIYLEDFAEINDKLAGN